MPDHLRDVRDDLGGIALGHSKRRDILADDAGGGNDGALSDLHTGRSGDCSVA